MRRLLTAAMVPLLATAIGCASLHPNVASFPQNTTVNTLYKSAADDELLLLNGNTWLVPLLTRNKNERVNAIGEYVHGLPKLPDVITFQEVWLQKHVKKFKELFPEYNAYYSHEQKKILGYTFNESGLLTLVKKDLSVSDVQYNLLDEEYTLRVESFLGKGSLSLTLQHAGNEYDITNIHLPNTHKDIFLKNTQGALESLKPEGILVGDLNLEPHELPAWLFSDDDTPTYTSSGKKRLRRLDYVFSDNFTNVDSVVLTDNDGYCVLLSDHCFVAAKIGQKSSSLETRIAEKTDFFEEEKAY